MEGVPVCGDRCIAGKLSCRCMAPRDQEAWECRSRLARTLILRRCIVRWGGHGVGAWLRVVVLCLLDLLGLWGHHTSLRRWVGGSGSGSGLGKARGLLLG